MNRLFSLPIRTQLFLVVSLMALFAAIIIVYSGMRVRNERIDDARQEVQSLAAGIAVLQQTVVTATEQLMVVLSRMPEVRDRDLAKLQATLGEIIKLNPQYSTIFITDLSGDIWVSALPTKVRTISDRESFMKALSSGRFSSGQYIKGQFSGKQVLSFYYPYRDDKGEIEGVIILGIDLTYHRQIIGNLQLPPNSNFLLLDHKGIVLSGGAKNKFAGQSYKEALFKQMDEGPETGDLVEYGLDGRKRFISYRKLRLAGEQAPYMYIRAGIPVEAVLPQANMMLLRDLGIFMTSLLIVFYLAWIIGKRSITDRVALLEKSSLRLAEGDLSVRVADLVTGGELGSLGRTFDYMAMQLGLREQDLKEREVRLSQSLSLQSATLESTADGILAVDREGKVVGYNRKFMELWQLPEAVMQLKDDRQILTFISDKLNDRDAFLAKVRMLDSRPAVKSFDGVSLKDGKVFEIYSHAQRMGDRITGRVWSFRDITERKMTEEALRRSEEFIRSILDNVDEGFIVVDRDYRIVTANKAFCKQMGEPCEKIIGSYCYAISHRLLNPCYEEGEDCAVRRVFETGDPHVALHRHLDREGAVIHVETKAFPLKDADGRVTSVIETITDISERHLLEEERLKTQKLEAIGTLAGGIAHDFRNLLQGVFGFISMAKQGLDRRGNAFEMIEQAEKALQMSVNLTTQLLTFSKGGKPVKKRLDLPPVIKNSAQFALSGSRSDYRFAYDDDLWPVEADEGQIGQVVQNIVLNASEAMPDGGTVEISARNLDARREVDPLLPAGGRFVSIVIGDKGMGISEHYLLRIFDPYFTTKQKGSGLGLATSYSIVRNHGGIIDVKSQSGKGSTFSIYLPAIEAEEAAPPSAAASAVGRRGKVLVMDDEEIVRVVAGKMIESLGHEADSAVDGEDAIEKVIQSEQAGKPFDIVILDLTVKGGMGGEQAAARLRQISPGVKLVVSSGYADNPVVSDYRSYGFAGRLNKPYVIDDLIVCFNALLI
jgi:two-component system, cell cycle sensor histidine kinase and response regulator CckA